jgi:hypothetical protein
MDTTPRESLKKALEDAGVILSGEETTDELLENRTVRLDASPPLDTVHKTVSSVRIAAISSGLVALLAVVVFFARPSGELPADLPAPAVPTRHSHSEVEKGAESLPEIAAVANTVRQGHVKKDSETSLQPSAEPEDAAAETDGVKNPPPNKQAVGAALDNSKMKKTGVRKPPVAVKSVSSGAIEKKTTTVKTQQKAAEWGWLNINSYPWSYVKVDGRKLDGHTPHRRVKLKAGGHVIEFENPELGLTAKKNVQVIPWEEANVGVRIDK